MTMFHSFLWLSNISLYIYTTSSCIRFVATSEHTAQPGIRKCRECQDETKLMECLWVKFHQKSKRKGKEHTEDWRQGATLEVHSPNQEHTATCKTALRSQARSEPTLFESLSYQEGRDEHQNCQCEVAENHWLECSQPHQVLQHSAESSRNHLLASQISPQIYNPALSLHSKTQLHK